MMQEMSITESEITLGPFLGNNEQIEKPWEAPEVETTSLPGVVRDQVAESHPNTWRKYCDGRLEQFRASR